MKSSRAILFFSIVVIAILVLGAQRFVLPASQAAVKAQLMATVELSGGNAIVEIITVDHGKFVPHRYDCLVSDDTEDILISNTDEITADRGKLVRSLVRAAVEKQELP